MIEQIIIQNQIYEIRGKQVMLDSDLAKLYQCKNGTKEINQAVKNNKDKFPERYSWVVSKDEYEYLQSKVLTANSKRRTLPRVFTEQGVAMLATILKTEVATKTSIAIMDAFVEMKKYISSSLIENNYYKNMILNHENEIRILKESLYKFEENKNYGGLFFKNQIYDAYTILKDILNSAEKNIIIIDNYIDKSLLDVLKGTKKDIIIITNKYNNNDYRKYKEQYQNIKLIINQDFHDRFIIIDNKVLYHCGASLKDLGKKCFCISQINNDKWLKELLDNINI